MKNKYQSQLIPSSFFKGNLNSFLFLVLFSLILTYALSGIIYFTNLVIVSGMSNKYEFGVVVQNFAFSFISVFVVWGFIKTLDFRINSAIVKYLIIFFVIEVFVIFASWFIYEYIWKDLGAYERNGSVALDIGFQAALIPGIVGVLYYYFWKNSQRILQKIDEQEVKLLQLEQNKTRAELAALEARINPHFLYNSLNSIASLVHEKPDVAEEMTLKLSALFRKTTSRDNSTHYSLSEEFDIVKTYLEIEQIRFGENLSYEAVANEECLQAKVPKFIIQPLVENAIKHGTSKLTSKGFIKVSASKIVDNLEITVHDNGSEFSISGDIGYGLNSIQEKIKLLYGAKANLSIENSPQKLIRITIPYEKS